MPLRGRVQGQTLVFRSGRRAAEPAAEALCVGSFRAVDDEFRAEVELDDDEHGYSFGERLRALDLDDDARERLGGGVLVSRDGSRLFLYAASEAQAREAAEVVRKLAQEDELTRRDPRHALAPDRGGLEGRVDPASAARRRRRRPSTRRARPPRPARPPPRASTTGTSSCTCRDATRPPSSPSGSRRRGSESHDAGGTWSRAPSRRRAPRSSRERLRAELGDDVEIAVEANLSDLDLPAFQFVSF